MSEIYPFQTENILPEEVPLYWTVPVQWFHYSYHTVVIYIAVYCLLSVSFRILNIIFLLKKCHAWKYFYVLYTLLTMNFPRYVFTVLNQEFQMLSTIFCPLMRGNFLWQTGLKLVLNYSISTTSIRLILIKLNYNCCNPLK